MNERAQTLPFSGFLLQEGPLRYVTDAGKEVHQPHSVTLAELLDPPQPSPIRAHLLGHLAGMAAWFFAAGHGDASRRMWVRGIIGSTQWAPTSRDDLDLVLHYDPTTLSPTDRWLMGIFEHGKPQVHPGRIVVTALDVTAEAYSEFVEIEAIRSRVAAIDPYTEEPAEVGWVELDGRGEVQ